MSRVPIGKQRMKQVYIARDLIEAQSVKNRLDADGIESVVQGDRLSAAWGAIPIAPDTSPSVWVVRDDEFDMAIECIEQMTQHSPIPPAAGWKCERCGEMIDAQFTECWKCADEATAEAAGLAEAEEPEFSVESDADDSASTTDTPAPILKDTAAPSVVERSDRELWIESCLVILVSVLPYLYAAIGSLVWAGQYQAVSSLHDSLSRLVWVSVDVGLIGYLIWRSGSPSPAIDLGRPRWLVDPLFGLAILGADWAIEGAAWRILYGFFDPDVFRLLRPDTDWVPPTPTGLVEIPAFVLTVCAGAFAEELVMRAYLLPRFERLLGSSTRSVIVTSLLFASLHIYQGLHGTIGAFFMGIVFGMMFVFWRRVWPLAIAHAVGNLIAYWNIFAERV